MEQEVELLIIGGGPAGVAAGVYAGRKKLRTTFITEEFGGQSIVSTDIKNWIGTASISGIEFAKSLENHLREYESENLKIIENKVTMIQKDGSHFVVTLQNDITLQTKTVLIASGSTRRRLNVEGADEFEHKGLTYCASCDGPLFTGHDVAVIGGGNAGFETAAQLLAYTKSVTLLNRSAEFKADKITVDKVMQDEKMKAITDMELTQVYGEKFVKGLKYKKDDKEHDLPVTGIFVEIGLIPSTDIVKNLVELDTIGRIIVDPTNQRTSLENIWAAGDCTNGKFHQNNIAAGDAVKAIEDIYLALRA